MIKLLTPQNGACISTLSAEQANFLNSQSVTLENQSQRCENEDKSLPCPVRFCFDPKIDGTVVLNDAHGHTTEYAAHGGVAYVYNLFTGTEYSWYVRIGYMRSESSCFFTESDVPRLLLVDGLSNVRDIGGYESSLGGRVRQGMVYRSSELDCSRKITQSGIKTLVNELGIRTDLDLRGANGEPVGAVLDSNVIRWVNFPMEAYSEIFTQEQKQLYRKSFEFLANKDVYPIVAHCQAGMDRTGTWIYVLGALLGIDEGDLMSDYETSSFSVWGPRSRHSNTFQDFLKLFHSYGKSARLAAEGFLTDCGVSKTTIDKIRDILVEI